MSITNLKQYITKELQTKRFLTESLEAITELENFEATVRQLTARVSELSDEIYKLSEKQKTAQETLAETEQKIEAAKKYAIEIEHLADLTVAAKHKTAEDDIKIKNADALQKLDEIDTAITVKRNILEDVEAQTKKAKLDLEEIQNERKRILERYV